MSGERRRGLWAAAVLVLGSALVTALLVDHDRGPVDVRLVAPKVSPPTAVTVTATTTMAAIGVPPPPPPVVVERKPIVVAPVASTPPVTTTTRPGKCDFTYVDKHGDVERCVPVALDLKGICRWFRDLGIKEIKVRDRDGHGLDLDLGGDGCGD